MGLSSFWPTPDSIQLFCKESELRQVENTKAVWIDIRSVVTWLGAYKHKTDYSITIGTVSALRSPLAEALVPWTLEGTHMWISFIEVQ